MQAGAGTILDGQGVVRTLLNSAVDKTTLHGPRGPEYERTGAASLLWYLYDGLGSVLGTVDANGNLVSTRKYDVYGAVRGSTGPSGARHKYVGGLGHPSDAETGLVYMRARYHDPVTGRFTSEDPAKDGANWFSYANSNPTNDFDSRGKRSAEPDDFWARAWWFIIHGAKLLGVGARHLGAFLVNQFKALAMENWIEGKSALTTGLIMITTGMSMLYIEIMRWEGPF